MLHRWVTCCHRWARVFRPGGILSQFVGLGSMKMLQQRPRQVHFPDTWFHGVFGTLDIGSQHPCSLAWDGRHSCMILILCL